MRERTLAVGGIFTAGPTPEGGMLEAVTNGVMFLQAVGVASA
ncbi:hypothetical protein AB0L00_14965 [Actinoallomurus sp. NPDC052308]